MSAPAPRRTGLLLAVVASAVVVATLATAILVGGTPSQRRAIRLDERRVNDLQAIEQALRRHARDRRLLPPDLATLASEPGRRLQLADPVSGEPYQYRPQAGLRYELCAEFATDSAANASATYDGEWLHGKGTKCFPMDAGTK